MIPVKPTKPKEVIGCALILRSLSFEGRWYVDWLSSTTHKVHGCGGTQDINKALIYNRLAQAQHAAKRINAFYNRLGSMDTAKTVWIVQVGNRRVRLVDLMQYNGGCGAARGIKNLADVILQSYGEMVATPPF